MVTGVEAGQAAREDVERVISAFCSALVREYIYLFPAENITVGLQDFAPDDRLTELLTRLTQLDPTKPLVLFIDENLAGAITELRQAALDATGARGIELLEVTHDGVDHADHDIAIHHLTFVPECLEFLR